MRPAVSAATLELDLAATADAPAVARRAVCQALEGLPLDLVAVELVVSEAVTNVVIHAYRDRATPLDPGRARVSLSVAPEGLSVSVEDDGLGMGPRFDSPGAGLGLLVMTGLCAELRFVRRHRGTRVVAHFAFGDRATTR